MIYLYRYCVDELCELDSTLISPARLEKASRIKDITAKKACIAVELLLCQHMLSLGFKKSDFPLNIVLESSGKPCFDPESGLPYFSFSHSHNMALCGVSDAEIGVDIEKLRDLSGNDRLFEKIHAAKDDVPSLIHAWSAKEAYLKLTGEGIGGKYRLSDIQVCENTVLNTASNNTAHLLQFEDEGFVVSVCAWEKCKVEYKIVDS